MRSTLRTILRTAALAGAGLLLTTGVSSAADVYLQAQSFEKALPGGTTVPMWGFASCTDATFASCDPPTATDAPGPQINILTTDTLTIHLKNTLLTPVSIVIPGQAGGGDPEWTADAQGRRRVRSFAKEIASGASDTYTWSSLRPGTYLYQSGTHPSIQVPMGLYGALVVGPATLTTGSCTTGQPAYDNVNSCHDADAVLLLSEIDPAQNAAVAAAAGVANYPSTVDYTPTYFLINGEPYNKTTPPAALLAGDPNDSVLLRFLNAGLRSHTPTIVGLDMGLIAEDGNPYPGLTKKQSAALLPAGKTLDALVAMPALDATYPLFDRMLDLSNDNQPDGGMLAYLQVGTGSTPPGPSIIYAVNDTYPVTEDTALIGAASVLTNDVGLAGATVAVVAGPSNGTLVLNSGDGTFTYTPNQDFSGPDGFTYSASLAGNSYPAQVSLNVSFENDVPVSSNDGLYVNTGPTLTVDAAHGVLGNDSDPDGDVLTVAAGSVIGPSHGSLTMNTSGSFTYNPNGSYSGPDSFTYRATDGTAQSAGPATVTLKVHPVANITLNVQDPLGASVTAYRWLVQEDATYDINPAAPPDPADTLSTNFHKSYMPVVAQGCVGIASPTPGDAPCSAATPFDQLALDPTKRYYVSVLPNDAGTGVGHSIGGAQIPPGPVNPPRTVTVIVNNQPIPTAQLSVIAFEDISPTNGVPEASEPRLGGFQVTLEDAGGRYGISGGTMSQDAFGNPLKNSLFGTAACPGTPPVGVILTCPDGTALIKDLPPGKYGVVIVAPAGSGRWTQTSTIEGTKLQDNWVKAGEPPFLVEFGAPGFHAFIGFVNPDHLVNPGGLNTITGNVTMVHTGRAPNNTAFEASYDPALAHTRAWVGVNSNAGTGPNIATVQAAPDGSFSIGNIPDGTYQLAIWDEYLDQIISYRLVTVPGGGAVGTVPVPTWFGRHEHNVFLDSNQDGIRQTGEQGLPDKVVNLRFRDGTVEQSFPTDTEGFVPFDQVFPYGAWQVAEIDFARFKPTGVTVTVDGGGDVSGGPYPDLLNPQVQAGGALTRTETGPVLLEGFQSQPGMTSIFEWGKAPYAPGENGGIAGIVYYASTRGENDPRLTVGDPWEPGIPGVKVRLYREVATSAGGTALALVQEVQTDSWDAATPTGCPGEITPNAFVDQTLNGDATRCFDGIRNYEQVRPGAVFDGGYAFAGIPPGKYVVEVVPPPGYELYKEEDKNVDFGDAFAAAPVALMLPGGAMLAIVPDQAMVLAAMGPEPGLAQPPCVGPDHLVSAQLSLFPGVDTYAPFAGAMRPLCIRKQVILSDQAQAAADFHLFTSTPVAGQFRGLTTDDIAVETNPASPSFGDKWGPAFMPISMRDFKGQEIYRSYTDAFGLYNGVLPSTFSANIPVPSGYSPAMHFVCLNDPGPLPDGTLDPLRNPNYGIFCYTLMYMPGTTTYLDTPLLPNAAFAAGYNSVDCAYTDGTPVIAHVESQSGGPNGFGPWIHSAATGSNRDLMIASSGTTTLPNPAYEGPLATAPYNLPIITRDSGFGDTQGTVTVGGTPVTIVAWANDQIRVTMPAGALTGELVVTRGDNGKSSINTVTVTVSAETPIRVPAGGSIQAAIDAAAPGSLILVAPGTYEELVVMWKPVRLQGSGAATIINAIKRPTEKLDAWRTKVKGLIDNGSVDLLPGQPGPEFDIVGGGLFGTELGAGITVLAKNDPANASLRSFSSYPSRIDGFTITGADGGGGIFVNGYAHNLEIANNYVTSNSGVLHGGIRVGHPSLPLTGAGPFGFNLNQNIHHNAITLNGAQSDTGAGGGVALSTGTDNYAVSRNFICGNFNLGDGGGIAHLGLSTPGRIDFNQVLFNQSFNQGLNRSGGGVLIAGEPPAVVGGLTLGAGNVTVDANLIQGNQAGTGHGGGVRTQNVNGTEATPWSVTLTNNMIVNNVAGWSGAGISLQDTTNGSIINNTIADNDTTATVGGLIVANASTPQPAGISAERHSLALAAALGDGFSNPTLFNNIVWHNRAFYYDATTSAHLEPVLTQSAVGDCAAGANYWDLGVLGEPQASPTLQLNPTYSILTDTTGYDGTNLSGDPDLLSAYCNGARTLSTPGPMQVAAEIVEGGNFIDVRYGPLMPVGNYHIAETSPAINRCPNGPSPGVDHDFDSDVRRVGQVDLGADEVATIARGAVTYSSGAFGNVLVGSTATLTITATVSVAPVMFSSSTNPAAPFAKTADTCSGNTVAVGGTCTFTVTFSPTSGIMSSGSFTVSNDAACDPQTVSLSGTGVAGMVAFSSGAFGPVLVGSTATLTVTATVSVAPVTFTTSTNPATPFAKTADGCAGTTVAAGGTCTFTVTFSPTSGATSSGSFTVTDNAVGTPQTVSLTGTGVPGIVAFSSGAFGNVPVGTTATNTITATVSVAPVTFTSSTDPAAPFVKTADTCAGTTVPAGGTCTFSVTYSPTTTTTSSGSFTVSDNGAASPQTVSLTGTGVRGTVAFSSGAFGNVPVGTMATRTITATVSVYPVTFTSSTNPALPFAKTADTCAGTTVPVGGTCTFTVTYTPTTTATSNGSFTVTDNAVGSPQTVSLSGSGVRGTVAFSSGAFGTVLIGTTATRTITATVSQFPVTFTSSTNPALPFAKTADTCAGTTVPVGGTCTFTVTYTPTTTATSNGSFTVTDNAVGSPQTVSLSGTGVRQVAFTSATVGTLISTAGGGSLAFGNRSGLVSSTLTLTVRGTTPVTFGTLGVTNVLGTAFTKGADTCSNTTRSLGSTCTVIINFNGPAGNSARAGTLTVPHNGALSPTPLTLILSGS